MTTPPTFELLLVEDSPADAGLIQANLKIGLGSIEVARVDRLSSAVELLAKRRFSAILLDLNLPDSTGLETFRRLSAESNGTPIVVLSGMEGSDTALEAVGAGADDYVHKQHYDANTLARSVRFAIERNVRRSTERELVSVRSELSAAQHIQDSLYPEQAPQIEGLEIAAGVISADIGCGDYYDFIELADGRHLIVVGDVSGHGMASAIVMAETRACLRTLIDVKVEPGGMLPAMNRLIHAGTSESMFVTLLLFVYDPQTREFVYFNAGHPGWIIRRDGRQRLNTHQMPLGLIPDLDFSNRDRFQLEAGDILVVPTDGIAETPLDQEMFGNARMLSSVETNRRRSSEAIVAELFATALNWGKADVPTDDMTVVVVKAL